MFELLVEQLHTIVMVVVGGDGDGDGDCSAGQVGVEVARVGWIVKRVSVKLILSFRIPLPHHPRHATPRRQRC